mmetsp:Transcript_20929/g.53013  ORF Transcript_20929/g.53013 Transcript_20929/m.53013 type:complete len:114 (+) Transcript_20929:145-486(+)|eukprot:CAMPEP_0177670184 /NCGR_PEP_ID=MMETSP0447-20121125/23930_1 /TAXON_ID=0 /ORGANISM="Stygamoeba regulata, Strain BSH-02190019" /LENGTH=113 /DNA_ID=CAMNT_0019177283 /DNA_START=79 /DNA_END=420 /DNA_ORIENTATION=+
MAADTLSYLFNVTVDSLVDTSKGTVCPPSSAKEGHVYIVQTVEDAKGEVRIWLERQCGEDPICLPSLLESLDKAGSRSFGDVTSSPPSALCQTDLPMGLRRRLLEKAGVLVRI